MACVNSGVLSASIVPGVLRAGGASGIPGTGVASCRAVCFYQSYKLGIERGESEWALSNVQVGSFLGFQVPAWPLVEQWASVGAVGKGISMRGRGCCWGNWAGPKEF